MAGSPSAPPGRGRLWPRMSLPVTTSTLRGPDELIVIAHLQTMRLTCCGRCRRCRRTGWFVTSPAAVVPGAWRTGQDAEVGRAATRLTERHDHALHRPQQPEHRRDVESTENHVSFWFMRSISILCCGVLIACSMTSKPSSTAEARGRMLAAGRVTAELRPRRRRLLHRGLDAVDGVWGMISRAHEDRAVEQMTKKPIAPKSASQSREAESSGTEEHLVETLSPPEAAGASALAAIVGGAGRRPLRRRGVRRPVRMKRRWTPASCTLRG